MNHKISTPQKIIMCVLMIVLVFIILFFKFQIDFQTYWLGVMKKLNSSETKSYIQDKINGTYDFIELLKWVSQNINWSKESFTRYFEPQQILSQGKGMCAEFAIVYVAACLALDYEARIVVSRQFYLINGFHVWAEVKVDGIWTHIDPSPTAFWNDTTRYKSWDWGPRITLKVFAFEDNKIEDVTSRYK